MCAATDFGFRIIACGCLLLLIEGCAAPPAKVVPPLVPAQAAVERVDHFIGTPLSGPLAAMPGPVRPGDALRVDVTFIAVERVSPRMIDPLASSERLILATRGSVPVRSAARLTRAAGFASGETADRFDSAVNAGGLGRTSLLARLQGALPPGATVRFEIAEGFSTQATTQSAIMPGRRRLAIDVYSPPGAAPGAAPHGASIQLSIVLEDWAPPDTGGGTDSTDEDNPAVSSRAPTLQQETVVLDPQAVKDPLHLAVMVPLRFPGGGNQGVVAIIHVAAGSAKDSSHVAACAMALADLQRAYVRVTAQHAASPDESVLYGALEGMLQPSSTRSATVFLCGWSGARICEDVALSTDDATLAKLAQDIVAAVGGGPTDKRTVAWQMDRTALGALAKLQADGQLPPELYAVLTDQAGEAGRHPSAMEEVLLNLRGPEELTRRLGAMNLLFLEDNSPASRVRAFEWLKRRDQAPAGFDPLGPARDRRIALEKAATRPSTPQPGGVP